MAAAGVGAAAIFVAAVALAGVLLSPRINEVGRRTWLVGSAVLVVAFSLVPLLVLMANDSIRTPVAVLGGLALLLVLGATATRLGKEHRRRLASRDAFDEDVDAVIAQTALIDQTHDVILIVDDEDRIRFASPSARSLLGTSALRDVPLLDLIPSAERHAAQFLLRHARGETGEVARADWTIHVADGGTAQVEVACKDLRADSDVRGLVVTLRDVTTQRRLEQELVKRMLHDPVTGLPNGILFADRAQLAVAEGSGVAGAIVVDLDQFRAVNEVLGREEGDAVLTAVGARLRQAAGTEALVARSGGDEFAVLVTHLDSVAAVEAVAERITDVLSKPLPGRADGLSCSGSVGVATNANADSGVQMIRNAEQALDVAKAVGTGHWKSFDPQMTSAARYRMELRLALSRAIEDGALVVLYQPIVDLHSGRTVGFESLVRWNHPSRGLLSPAEFIDVAEESGLITSIGDYVLGMAIGTALSWARVAPRDPPYVAVNISGRQFRAAGFVDVLGRRMDVARLSPGRMVIEITESLLLRDDDEVWEHLKLLRRRGFRIAIDDFGTGYSALGYLRQVPLDIVKLDRTFISTMEGSRRQRDLVYGIVRLTQALNLTVVAEGIETERQRAIAIEAGCEFGQGYLFSRPMSDADSVAWLSHARI